jgi:hypothetical protein
MHPLTAVLSHALLSPGERGRVRAAFFVIGNGGGDCSA